MTEHEAAEERMRDAAERVLNVPAQDLDGAVTDFFRTEADWFNSIPRDGNGIPEARE